MFACLNREELTLVNLKLIDLIKGIIHKNYQTKGGSLIINDLQISFTQQEISQHAKI
jgi:hypothetical protein